MRHGEPALPSWQKIGSSRMPEWINAYNTVGVIDEVDLLYRETPYKLEHRFIVCSNLTRSIHSAKIIGYPSPNVVDKIFREAELPELKIPIARLTPHAWTIIFRVLWFAGFSAQAESIALFKKRVSLAADKLIEYAAVYSSVLLIGHGILNRFLAKELLSKGWSGDAAPNGNKY